MDLIEIFKTGTHTDSGGKTRDWTDKDLEEIAALYKPEIHEAPIVIGHPEHDSPAYGWVESLKVEGGKLLASVKDVADEFKDWVRKGLYKKISIALYPDLGLRHVGFLGATPPAVKGLKQAAFGDKQAAWKIETDFQYMDYWQQEAVKSIFQRMRDWMIDKFSLEEADKVVSSYDIEALKPEPPPTPSPLAGEGGGGGFAETHNKPADAKAMAGKGGKSMDVSKFFSDLKAMIIGAEKELVPAGGTAAPPPQMFTEADVQARVNAEKEKAYAEAEKERKERIEFQEKLRTIETKARKDEIASFCESLCKEGKLTPALRKIIEPIMIAVSSVRTEPVEVQFAEGIIKPALDGIKDFLTELPKVVNFKEVAGDDKLGPGSGATAAEKLSALTKKKMDENKDLSFGAAFIEAQRENPELAKEYQTEITPQRG